MADALLLIGLGNPGARYADCRHNAGFMILESIGDTKWKRRFDGLFAERRIAATTLLMLKPASFYNESGRSAVKAARFYKLAPERIIVFHDDIDLACGRIRVKSGGGHAGNNGMRSIIAHLGADVRRVRVGIGHPGHKDKVRSYVLSPFAAAERAVFERLKSAMIVALPFLIDGKDDRFQCEVMRLVQESEQDGV